MTGWKLAGFGMTCLVIGILIGRITKWSAARRPDDQDIFSNYS
mgnify:CR=1 FL=1